MRVQCLRLNLGSSFAIHLCSQLPWSYSILPACELAAKHYQRKGDLSEALHLFIRAEKCYQQWGMQKRVDRVMESIEQISSKKHEVAGES